MKKHLMPSNPDLIRLYDKHTGELLRRQDDNSSYTFKVRSLLVRQLREESPGIEIVADHLSMSVRSLQMKLKDEGTSYQKILNALRKNLAIAYLREQSVSKGEIAHMLGFSEISVFSRTFKKWTGKSPSEYQATQF
ncbi:MAG: helix-turn-helix transcriptional regulator [Bacteroidota bacterium]